MDQSSNNVQGGRTYPVEVPASAPSQYGFYTPPFKKYRIYLDNAKVKEKQGIGGTFIWAYYASSTSAQISIQFNSELSDPVDFFQGTQLSGFQFSEVYLTSSAQAGEYIDLLVTTEGKGVQALNPVNTFTSVTVTKATDLHSHSDVTITAGGPADQIRPADATRRSIMVQSDPDNDQVIRVGSSATDATHGHILQPGESIEFDVTAAVYGYTAAGSDQNVTVVAIHD